MPEVISFQINTITFLVVALYLVVLILHSTVDNLFTKDHKVIDCIVLGLAGLIYAIPAICLISGLVFESQPLIISWILTSVIFLISVRKA